MLIPLVWFRVISVGSSHPVQPAISVLPKTPGIVQGGSILASSSENDHHAIGSSSSADAGSMIDSRRWILKSSIDFFPDTSPSYIDLPNIPNCFRACISTKNDDERFQICNYMPIPCSWSCSFTVLDLPKGFVA